MLDVNENFAACHGLLARRDQRSSITALLVEQRHARAAEYRAFWEKLARGESDGGSYKRIAKGGREVWIQASYNPIADVNGKPFKVVEVRHRHHRAESCATRTSKASSRPSARRRPSSSSNSTAPSARSTTTSRTVMGYSNSEVRGKHHSMLVDPAISGGAEYRAFWAKLGRGEAGRRPLPARRQGRPRSVAAGFVQPDPRTPTAGRSKW